MGIGGNLPRLIRVYPCLAEVGPEMHKMRVQEERVGGQRNNQNKKRDDYEPCVFVGGG